MIDRARSREVTTRMNGSLMDMEDIGSPLEWQNDMQAGIDEIYRLRTALAASEARLEKAREALEAIRDGDCDADIMSRLALKELSEP